MLEFGLDKIIVESFFKINREVPKGSFQLLKRKKFHYWYFKLSKGENRTLYLCRGFAGKNEFSQTSFEQSLQSLKNKFSGNQTSIFHKRRNLSSLIDEYIDFLDIEGRDPHGRRKMTTITGMVTSLRNFKKFSVDENIKVVDVEKKEFRNTIRHWINLCTKRNLSRNTIRKQLVDIRSLFNWLVNDDYGKGLIKEHFISQEFLISHYPPKRNVQKSSQQYFSSSKYVTMVKECNSKIRDIWIDFIKHGISKPHPNQPYGIGTDIVFLISLFQLDYGFRIGEILFAYRNFDSWINRMDKKPASSYFKKDNGKWFLIINDYKNKDGMVAINHTIRSWQKPPDDIPTNESKGKVKYWDTNIVDVCTHIFPDSTYMFPSPNYRSKPNKPYSITYYMNLFKARLVNQSNDPDAKFGWERYGIKSSHDLRDYFISYNIAEGILTPYQLSTITRHNISTMEKYYVRLDFQNQWDMMTKIDPTNILKSKK